MYDLAPPVGQLDRCLSPFSLKNEDKSKISYHQLCKDCKYFSSSIFIILSAVLFNEASYVK